MRDRTSTTEEPKTLFAAESNKIHTTAPFIVGVSRSGTTLLRLMLDAHSKLVIPPETHFIPKAVKGCKNSEDPHRAFLSAVVESNPRWNDYRLDADALRERVYGIEPFDVAGALRAFYETYAKRFGKPRWGDKTPGYFRNMKMIKRVLPEARFVHLIRDGRDVALSATKVRMGPERVQEWAERWQFQIGQARDAAEAMQQASPGSYIEVRYEDLVSDSENVLKGICDFIDLPWDGGMLNYHERATERIQELEQDLPGRTGKERVSMHALTKNPPLTSKVAGWKTEMPYEQVTLFERVAGKTLSQLGYDRIVKR